MTLTQSIDAIADAIAYAEGYFVSGSRADRNNNPGNLTQDITGTAIGTDDIFMVYATTEDGWDALKRQVELIMTNASGIYNSDMTLYEIAQRYTTTQQLEWATNVASRLGIPLNVPISSLLGTQVVGAGVLVIVLIGFWLLHRKGRT